MANGRMLREMKGRVIVLRIVVENTYNIVYLNLSYILYVVKVTWHRITQHRNSLHRWSKY